MAEQYRRLYEELGVVFVENGAHCPLHTSITPTLGLDHETGRWTCSDPACGRTGDLHDMEEQISIAASGRRVPPLIEEDWKPAEDFLNDSVNEDSLATRELVTDRTGLNEETLTHYHIGWWKEKLAIPINDGRRVMNVRRVSLENRTVMGRITNFDVVHAVPRLWPRNSLRGEFSEVWIAQDEVDCLLLLQLGLPAVTVTGPFSRWDPRWSGLFAGKKVRVIIGRYQAEQADRLSVTLGGLAVEVRILDMKLSGDEDSVVAAVRDHKWGQGRFLALADQSAPVAAPNLPGTEKPKHDIPAIDVSLHRASHGDLVGRRVRVRVVASGKDLAPYSAPKDVTLTCRAGLRLCGACPIAQRGNKLDITVGPEDPMLLNMFACTDEEQRRAVIKPLGIPGGCARFAFKINTYQNVEEIKIQPEIEDDQDAGEYVMRQAFYIGDGTKTNQSYEAEGVALPHPKNQYVTFLFPSIKPVQARFDSFETSKASTDRLSSAFNPAPGQTPLQKWNDIAQDLETHVTKIIQRKDIIYATDLVLHSMLLFDFQNIRLQRGWVEGLVVGDTRCGKSETMSSLFKHYRAGKIVTGENVSFAGLIGGLQQTQNRWSITWGQIPLLDKRAIGIDEVSGIPLDDIGRFSGVRSSGIAEITKIQTERTMARTRKLWISNPRGNRALNSYSSGADVINGLIGRPEDVARFDFAQFASASDVPTSVVNATRPPITTEPIYTQHLCRELLLWSWSRTREQVTFTPEATEKCLEMAEVMSSKYGCDLPLVEPNEQRVKIARLAAACAARLFSTDDGVNLVVKPEHVTTVCQLMDKWYEHPAFDYGTYAASKRQEINIDPGAAEALMVRIGAMPEGTIDALLNTSFITRNDMMDIANISPSEAQTAISQMFRCGAIKKKMNGYVKTPGFITILRRERDSARALL